jgi:hypothetical protein
MGGFDESIAFHSFRHSDLFGILLAVASFRFLLIRKIPDEPE